MAGLYFDELYEGQEIEAEWGRTVTETDNVLFSSLTMNVQRLHLDAEYARQSEFGQPIVNSLFTLGLMVGMSVHNLTQGTTIANLGMKDTRFPRPVFVGDTLQVKTKVVGLRPSRSRPGEGIVTFHHQAFNQNGQLVAECERVAMMKRNASSGAPSPRGAEGALRA